MSIRFQEGGLDDRRVIALLEHHVATARAETARGSAHALDVAALTVPEISFWSGWDGDDLVAVGAVKRLSDRHGEVKSMHVAGARRRSGAGGAMLAHLIAVARGQGLERLSLETGSWDYFIPARALYAGHGFAECGPFEGYVADANSVFMTRAI
jgi:putative acetyltransferase